MELTRKLRKTLTFGALRGGMELACRGNVTSVERLRQIMTDLTRIAIPLRIRLARNMKLTGVYHPKLIDHHFERVIDQLIMLAHIFRAGFSESGCPERFIFDDSVKLLEQAYAKGKGVINIAPHICGYPVYAAVVSQRFPCGIYLRHNKDPRKMRLNNAIGQAGGGDLVYPPKGASKAQKLQIAIDVLRQGKLLFITPDTPRRPQKGIAVTIFDKTVYFPPGIFIMSMRTGAPVVPVFWDWRDGAYHIQYEPPIELTRKGRIKDLAEMSMQKWAKSVDGFLHEHPEMWWNWLDKHWTRIIRDGQMNPAEKRERT
ncbi:MAG: lysophospholipid acyltransferase family protein [Sedimentisphaerales bacterium]|nr:lysophospholipid acyltransferase family protein [Sedimentisphaerales bacterium]